MLSLIPSLNLGDIALGLVAGWLILKQPDFAASVRTLVLDKLMALFGKK